MRKWSESVCTVNVPVLGHSLHLSHNIKLSSERREHADSKRCSFLPDFLQKVNISVEHLTRTECKLKRCNSMCSEMRTFYLTSQYL